MSDDRVRKLIVRRTKASVQQEKRLAVDIGGRRVAGSGALQGMKGDVKEEDWLVEAKMTKANRYSLTLAVFRKIECEAIRAGRRPVLALELAGRTLAVVTWDDFLAMRNSIES